MNVVRLWPLIPNQVGAKAILERVSAACRGYLITSSPFKDETIE